MEKMLIAEALDEKDLLTKKIETAIANLEFATVRREKDKKLRDGRTDEEFTDQVKSAYQSVSDMIDRRNRIAVAIVESNAKTIVKLRSGAEMTVAEAITRKKIMTTPVDANTSNVNLEKKLIKAMESAYVNFSKSLRSLQLDKDNKENDYKTRLTTREKELGEEDIKAIETLVQGETPVIVDPLNLKELLTDKAEKYNALAKELETAIKISNASTYIEF